jgi:hypothetical protein
MAWLTNVARERDRTGRLQVICHLLASNFSGEVPKRRAPHHRRQ